MKNLIKRMLSFLTSIAIIAITCFTISPEKSHLLKANAASNEQIIYEFLKDKCGLNTAAACGVLANIEKESNFRSNLLEGGYTCTIHNLRKDGIILIRSPNGEHR